MFDYQSSALQSLCVHRVGNQANGDGIILSKHAIEADDEVSALLSSYFFGSFKSQESYRLFHDTDLNLNEVYSFVSAIFDNPDSLLEQSVGLAKHLYDKSTHPNIKGGEFYVARFTDCMVEGCNVDAVGLFKSENKDVFLKVYPSGEGFEIESQQGININRLDKGALIVNLGREEGYIVYVVDNTNRSADARYWVDEFLHVKQREDCYYNTENALALCKKFVTKELPQQFNVTKADQADMLNRSVDYFKKNDTFDSEEFANEVIGQPEVIDSFNAFKDSFSHEREIDFSDGFAISDSAVKKQSRSFKSVIKLDKNFHIYVHGNRNLIEQGEDEKGKFYKVYFQDES